MAAVVKKHQQPADYARKPQQRPPDLRQEPWLVYSHGKKNDKKSSQTFYSLSEPGRGYHVRGIPELRNQIICACSHGWLVLLDPVRRGCGLLNPVTMERIGLPDLPGEFVVTNCALSCSPEESGGGGCVVMFTERERGSFVYCRVGGKEEEGRYWRREEVVDQGSCACGTEGGGGGGGEGFMWCHAMASLGGEFYVLTSCCESLFKVEFVEEEVRAGGSDDDDDDDQVDESIRLV
ncbi:unnamed protein product [Linum trigynum]|uniref:KIB1-4 beta-propeller domain-containing protein n=1 Tax=Linum trigynum TaxID=586398 RepID=A0AAV2GJE5_9ROSI